MKLLLALLVLTQFSAFAELVFLEPSIKPELQAKPGHVFQEDAIEFHHTNTFGKIDRVDSNSKQFPGSAIGKLQTPSANCTAGLIADEYIISASHCFYNKDKEGIQHLEKGDYIFYHSFHNDRYYDSAYVTHITSGYVDGEKAKNNSDWVIGKLNRPLGKKYGYLGFVYDTNKEIETETPIEIIGYGSKFWSGDTQSRVTNCGVKNIYRKSDTFLHDCDTSKGDSGAPVFVNVDGQSFAVGLHVAQFVPKGSDKTHFETYKKSTGNIALFVNPFSHLLKQARNGNLKLKIKLNNRKSGEHLNYYYFSFTNNCHEEVQVAFNIKTLKNKWEKMYWYDFKPKETSTISHDKKLVLTKNTIMYYYAKSKNFYWYGSDDNKNDRNYYINGTLYGFRYAKLKYDRWGSFNIAITCKNSI